MPTPDHAQMTPVRLPEVSGSWQSLLYPGNVALSHSWSPYTLISARFPRLLEHLGLEWIRGLLGPLITCPPVQPLSRFLGTHCLFMYPHFSPVLLEKGGPQCDSLPQLQGDREASGKFSED